MMTTTQTASVTEYSIAFRNWQGILREIDVFTAESQSEAWGIVNQKVNDFCAERGFKIYYINVHNHDDTTIMDVGSHSEFFHITPAIPFEAMHDE